MKAILRALGVLLLLAALVIGGLAVAARFSDGPVAVLPGGPLTSGELVPGPVLDWSFARDVEEVELQLVVPPRSRTVWIVVDGRDAYVPCGFLDVPLWKQWPHEALEDGRALVRIEGRRYEVTLRKVDDPALHRRLGSLAAEKYALGGAEATPDALWFFRLEPRQG